MKMNSSSKSVQHFLNGVEFDTNNGCWLWGRSIVRRGYGRTHLSGKAISAHRASWILHRGPIPARLFVLHRCDTPLCVNPNHLFLGTQQENVADMTRKGRRAGLRTAQSVVDEIKRLRANGISCRVIASLTGVSKSAVAYLGAAN